MHAYKLTQKYQVTIPLQIRKKLHLRQGDLVEFVERDGKILLQKPSAVDWDYLSALEGTLEEWASDDDEEAYGDL